MVVLLERIDELVGKNHSLCKRVFIKIPLKTTRDQMSHDPTSRDLQNKTEILGKWMYSRKIKKLFI